jgi:SAM-dependent methyltransferase
MPLDRHYTAPRLVDLYDLENPPGVDTDFYLQLADHLGAQQIIDLGCGTGLLTRELAGPGRQVTGVDPARVMLDYARRQPGADRVTWVNADARALGTSQADLVLMTGNVAQVFLDDAAWAETLTAVHDALKPGGHLAFESRNPKARAWQAWTPQTTAQKLDTPEGPVETWLEVVGQAAGTVSFKAFNRFLRTGEIVVVDSTLRFRSQDELRASLQTAGLFPQQIYGSWDRKPLAVDGPLMIFVAQRPLV